MSHFSKIKTQIHDIDCLKKALVDLHYRFETGDVSVTNYYKQSEKVDLAVRTGTKYDIGFRLQGEQSELIADWWGVERETQIKQQAFTGQVTQRYAYHVTMENLNRLSDRGFTVSETVTEENEIRLTVSWF